jgi:hypothetical protein
VIKDDKWKLVIVNTLFCIENWLNEKYIDLF